MLHNQCAFGIILGLHDDKELGYRMGLQISDDEVLFKHRGENKRNKLKNIKKANNIMDRIENYPSVALQRWNIQSYQRLDSIEEDDSNAESVDCSSGTDEQSENEEIDDDDSEDESRSH